MGPTGKYHEPKNIKNLSRRRFDTEHFLVLIKKLGIYLAQKATFYQQHQKLLWQVNTALILDHFAKVMIDVPMGF